MKMNGEDVFVDSRDASAAGLIIKCTFIFSPEKEE
jgi:hypothetical protein